jgi:excisionase family DNA binding protein
MERLLTPAEASQLLNVKTGTLYAWAHRGQIPYVRMGIRYIRFSESALQRWVEERTIQLQSNMVRLKREKVAL